MGRKERAFLDDAGLAPTRGKELTKSAFAKGDFSYVHHSHTLSFARIHPRETVRWLIPQVYSLN